MLAQIIAIDINVPHTVSIVICLQCLAKWVAVRPTITRVCTLECKTCGKGYVIESGHEL